MRTTPLGLLCAVLLPLLLPGNAARAQSGSGTPTVEFATASFAVVPSTGAVMITVVRSGSTSGALLATYTTFDQSAVAGTDYVATTGTLYWAAGDASPKSFAVPIASADPGNRSFGVTLISASGANFGAPLDATVTITANPVSPPVQQPTSVPTVGFAAAKFAAVASAHAALICATRYGAMSSSLVITFTTVNATALAGRDYAATSGTLSWKQNDAIPKCFTVPISATDQGGKDFEVALISASGANFGTPLEATVSITAAPAVGSAVPAPAAAVGYNVNTFNSTTPAANGGPWLLDNFYGQATNPAQVVQQANGSMSFPGSTGTGGMVATAHIDPSRPNNWSGLAFGGGAYFEATLSVNGQYVGDRAAGWPAFWSSDIERAAFNNVSRNYPGVQWQGEPTGYQHYIEVDVAEFDVNAPELGATIHDWSGFDGSLINVQNALFPSLSSYGTSSSASVSYGCLWVPATASSRGYVNLYVNRVLVGTLASWNAYNPAAPAPANPSASGPDPLSAFSVLDSRHLALIIGNDNPAMPMNVTSVQVWQASGADNLTQ